MTVCWVRLLNRFLFDNTDNLSEAIWEDLRLHMKLPRADFVAAEDGELLSKPPLPSGQLNLPPCWPRSLYRSLSLIQGEEDSQFLLHEGVIEALTADGFVPLRSKSDVCEFLCSRLGVRLLSSDEIIRQIVKVGCQRLDNFGRWLQCFTHDLVIIACLELISFGIWCFILQ